MVRLTQLVTAVKTGGAPPARCGSAKTHMHCIAYAVLTRMPNKQTALSGPPVSSPLTLALLF